MLASTGLALIVLALCLAVTTASRAASWILWPLAVTGMTSLTSYVLHIALIYGLQAPGAFGTSWALFGWATGPVVALAMVSWIRSGRGLLERFAARFAGPRAVTPSSPGGTPPRTPASWTGQPSGLRAPSPRAPWCRRAS